MYTLVQDSICHDSYYLAVDSHALLLLRKKGFYVVCFIFLSYIKIYSSSLIEFSQHKLQKSTINAYDKTEFMKKLY